ncbi:MULTISPECIES: response regulator [unclassified Pseudomonas]|jgi:DNA-binding NarL/FixJ family response regulator|uniref:response regulator n=1 Tax=unclassified Pseudomonas TaxID=196821 RepID=UPI001E5BAE79|nr:MULTISPECIES: response regulator transcription factor [unclassified Pseudomonas]MDC0686698.1 response regulator transcription factor [Mitsuaria sp. RG]MCE0913108.1 response regulator transcription factor [Pseudomonas sp. NMI760_13]MCF1487782.1 response regulator transcription factor [Pseudomonas sp. AA27]MCP8632662.1 response regulator transcription factor [Pseudomonas sp. DVZ6]MDD7784893.1 response regulator transcription factor [Pseudomonas sp. DVZ24]
MPCRILLADHSPLFRAGLRALLEQKKDFVVVGDTGDAMTAVSLAEKLKPDIVVLDMSGELDSQQALQELFIRAPACRVLMFSPRSELEHVMSCLQLGAHGFLLKSATVSELEQALQTLRGGGQYLSSAVLPMVIGQALKHSRKRVVSQVQTPPLTTRQLEILRLIARGETTRSIADGLGLSIKTVEAHRSQIMHRLQIHDVPGLVLFAVREGIIRLND